MEKRNKHVIKFNNFSILHLSQKFIVCLLTKYKHGIFDSFWISTISKKKSIIKSSSRVTMELQ